MNNETHLIDPAPAPLKLVSASGADLAALPFWMPVLAGLPISLCMAIMGLPELGHGHMAAFRALFIVAYVVWIFPLTYVQRVLWRRQWRWWNVALTLLALTYAMSLANNVFGQLLGISLGMDRMLEWRFIFRGLDGCWLALIAFCAMHAVVAYAAALGRAQLRVAEALALARDAQLHALRYQLHPHFLYNTLNAISALVAGERNSDATKMIARLADFLRATLDGGDCHEHALADELALTEGYLDIEKARLGNKLSVGIHIGPDVLNAYVPYLILQPLVENAIRHGIARRSDAGRLDLHVTRAGTRLRIRVDNDGPAPHAPLDAADSASFGGGIGIGNVGARLAQLYPNDHSFTVHPGASGNYSVSIELPLRAAAAPAQAWASAA
ncbi:MAG: histidine kinase [Sideroxyarcus sp.]|nr:histidine kinase [Sideroxyarcus sp.]